MTPEHAALVALLLTPDAIGDPRCKHAATAITELSERLERAEAELHGNNDLAELKSMVADGKVTLKIEIDGIEYEVIEDLGFVHDFGTYAKVVRDGERERIIVKRLGVWRFWR